MSLLAEAADLEARADRQAARARDVPRSCICRWQWRPPLRRWVLWTPAPYCPWHHRF